MLGLFALTASACEEAAIAEEAPPPPPVHVTPVREALLTAKATGTAEVRAVRSALLRAEAAGRVVVIDTDEGQHVEAGDVLLRLDVGRVETALETARAGVAQAEAALAQAERQRDLARRLVEVGSFPRQRLDDAEDGVRLARAALGAARAQTRQTRRGLTEAVVRAPFDGTVVKALVEVGELATPGSPLLQLVDASGLEAEVLLDPRLALDVPVGATSTVEAHARPGESFTAQVVRVAEVVDPRTRRLPVVVHIEDPDRRLRPGLTARIAVQTGEPTPSLVIPDEALFERYGEPHVFVVDTDGIALRRPVRVAGHEDTLVVIAEGLEQGEKVISAGLDRVVHDAPVTVVPERGPREGGDERPTASASVSHQVLTGSRAGRP